MDKLVSKLQAELQKQSDVEILANASWSLPIELHQLSFNTVKRTTMDVLMKMILITVQKMDINSAKELASFLSVEPIFAEDLIRRMQIAEMINKDEDVYQLTELGKSRLESGIYEHPPEQEEKKLFYSPCHGEYIGGERELDSVEQTSIYRWAGVFKTDGEELEETQLITTLQTESELDADNTQVVIKSVEKPNKLADYAVPCIEFLLINKLEERRYTRVWNTFLDRWDIQLEKQIEEQGMLEL
ncbi:hypothetical protein QR721_02425 [Aciduricibacillus chroicocephali]|uniref:Uncharacterized protein n=1 Tax=Aciduricibacillus chroicocephali TaxID=3054939 RepID=A0ABY9KZM3_9BACI|nr:hypothetical protein QR721_02425 [Bacillaceae bacterium 44XB]